MILPFLIRYSQIQCSYNWQSKKVREERFYSLTHITLENEQLHVEDFNNKWKLFIYGFAFLHALIIFSWIVLKKT